MNINILEKFKVFQTRLDILEACLGENIFSGTNRRHYHNHMWPASQEKRCKPFDRRHFKNARRRDEK